MKYIPIILEALSFLLITFDLYNHSATAINKDGKSPRFFSITAVTPILGYYIFIPCTAINFLLRVCDFPYLPWKLFVSAFFILGFAVFTPIMTFLLLTKLLSRFYTEERKPYFLSFGCTFFILSKVVSAYLLD